MSSTDLSIISIIVDRSDHRGNTKEIALSILACLLICLKQFSLGNISFQYYKKTYLLAEINILENHSFAAIILLQRSSLL